MSKLFTQYNMRRFLHAVLPAFLLAVSVGQIYAFTNFSSQIAEIIGASQSAVQFAFSLGIFFLGMGAAFFGGIVERNIRVSTALGTALFLCGMLVTAWSISLKSLMLLYVGYGVMVGMGTGIIYISPVKTMMLWFRDNKALASAVPIISFGLGATLSTLLFKGIESIGFDGYETLGVQKSFVAFAFTYLLPMICAAFLLRKPKVKDAKLFGDGSDGFTYNGLMKDEFFIRSWAFMLLNISCGLCLIPLAKQLMSSPTVGYSASIITFTLALSGLMNGGGRLAFAWCSDTVLSRHVYILPVILLMSVGVMALALFPSQLYIALLVVNACYGAGFSTIPAILSDRFGMENLSKIHGAVLSAWGIAGLIGNQLSLFVYDTLGFGYYGIVAMLIALYTANMWNAIRMERLAESTPKD